MSNARKRAIVDRKQRFSFDVTGSARVVVIRGKRATPSEVSGVLQNSSAQGVQLLLDDCIPRRESARLRIFFDDNVGNHDGELELDIVVRWSRPADNGRWLVGCDCQTELSDSVLGMFASRGQIERRRAARRPTLLIAMARWELSLDERPIEIIDAARIGFAFRAASMGSIGDRVLVRMTTIHGEEATIAAELRWKANSDCGYLGGCSLVNEEDHCCLMPFVVDETSDDAPGSLVSTDTKPPQRGYQLAFAVTLFLLFVGPTILIPPLLQASRERSNPALAFRNDAPPTMEVRLARNDTEGPLSDGKDLDTVDVERSPQPAPTTPPPPAHSPDSAETKSPDSASTDKAPATANDDAPIDDWPTDVLAVETLAAPSTAAEVTADGDAAGHQPELSSTEPGNDSTQSVDDAPPAEPEATVLEEAMSPEETKTPEQGEAAEAEDDWPVDAVEQLALPPVTPPATVNNSPAPAAADPDTSVQDVPEPTDVETGRLAAPADSPATTPSPIAPRADEPDPRTTSVISPATRRLASAAFNHGREALAGGDVSSALASFEQASTMDPDVALYQYHWALALHLADRPDAASDRIAVAARIEREHPVDNWGRAMQRVQGRPRIWLERARREALASGGG